MQNTNRKEKALQIFINVLPKIFSPISFVTMLNGHEQVKDAEEFELAERGETI